MPLDDSDLVGGYSGGGGLATATSSPTYTATLQVPSSQPDFNTAGAGDPTAILTSVAQAVTNVAGAIGSIQQAGAQASFNRAVTVQGDALARQQLEAQGKIAKLQTATQLAQAQQAYNRAAGIVADHSSLIIVLGVAGLVIAGLQLVARRKK